MWENAAAFNALIVLAEHHYFGKSVPFGPDTLDHMEFLSTQQVNFIGDSDRPADPEAFNRVVTFDMSEHTGAAKNCIPNLRRALNIVIEMSETKAGRKELAGLLRLCDAQSSDDVISAAAEAYEDLAMGIYPYPTSYIMDGNVDLLEYPIRVACEPFAGDFTEFDRTELINAFRESISVYYYAIKSVSCFFPASPAATINASDTMDAAKQARIDQKGNFWSYLECSEETPPLCGASWRARVELR